MAKQQPKPQQNGQPPGGGDATELKDRQWRRWSALKKERSSWDNHAKELAQNLMPRSSRFFTQDRNRGEKRHNAIYDNTGIRANRILAAGMMSGASSPARPWFRLMIPDQSLMASEGVKVWLSKVTDLMLSIFAASNIYRALHTTYGELGVFGTHSTLLMPDFRDVVRAYPMTFGEYCLAADFRGEIDTVYREFDKPVGPLVAEFGYDNCTPTVQRLYDRHQLDEWITVVQAIEPNLGRVPGRLDNRNMPWASTYFEQGAPKDKFLRQGGFKRFRGLCPRWQVTGGDIYGESPGMEALGDVKQLQHEQLRKAQGIDYMTKPPMQAPTAAKGQEIDLLPGGVSFVDMASPTGGIRASFEVKLDLEHLLADINDVRGRINSAFYADMFLMLAQSELSQPGVTATAVAEAHEEKLLMIGPVLERLHNELFSPMIDMVFDQIVDSGIMPPAPPEMHGQHLQVEFTSPLTQAQKAVGTQGVDRFVRGLGVIASLGKSSVLDKFDSDQWADWYSDALGVDPQLITADDKVAIIRQTRAKAQAQAQAAAQASDAAKAAQALGTVKTAGGASNAAADAIGMFSGYQSPQAERLAG